MQDYINGYYTKKGSRPLAREEIVKTVCLTNGMTAVFGYIDDPHDKVSCDVYKDEGLKDLIFMEHLIEPCGLDLKAEDIERTLPMLTKLIERHCTLLAL
jgi:hypothetical protein